MLQSQQNNCLELELDDETALWLNHLLGDFTHDFRNRLSSIGLSLTLLQHQVSDNDNANERLSQLRTQVRDLEEIVKLVRERSNPCSTD